MKIFKKIKDTIYSSYLCIRFPFFYPRNRFTGRHYNNWKYIEKSRKYYEEYRNLMSVHLCNQKYIDTLTEADKRKFTKQLNVDGYEYIVKFNRNGIVVETRKDKDTTHITTVIPNDKFMKNSMADNSDILQNGNIVNVFFEVSEYTKRTFNQNSQVKQSYTICVVTDYDDKKDEPIIEYKTCVDIIKNNKAKYKSLFYDYVNKFLSIFHFIPTYTELNMMPKGWRKAFGIQMFKEIKHSLIYTYIKEENISWATPIKYIKAYYKGVKLLYDFRIMDIKEKFSTLRVYPAVATHDVYCIIDKYEGISYNTCITCGKPAVWRTTGWICPYCDDCLTEDQKITAERIEEKNG